MALDFLKRLALVEKKSKFGRGERLQSQEITKAVAHNFSAIEIRSQYSWKPWALFYPVHQDHAFFRVNFAQANFDNFGVAGLYVAADVLRFDGHLAVAAVNQHAERNASRAAEVEEAVHGG